MNDWNRDNVLIERLFGFIPFILFRNKASLAMNHMSLLIAYNVGLSVDPA